MAKPNHPSPSAEQTTPGRTNAGSLIMSVFGDAIAPRGGRVWLGSLIGLVEPFGLNERLVRTAVFRLAREGWLVSEAHGRLSDYCLTESGQRRFEEASRSIYAVRSKPWDGRWRLVLNVQERAPTDRERLRRALFWQGFGQIGSDCFVHPSADLAAARDGLASDGLAHLTPGLIMLLADEQTPHIVGDANWVRRAWHLEALALAYTAFSKRYETLLHQTTHISDEAAFVLRTRLIHDWRRLLLRDPELPDGLLPTGWPGQSARQVMRALYQQLLPASERHLSQQLCLADGGRTQASATLKQRFT